MLRRADWTRKELEDLTSSMKAVTIPVYMRIEARQRIFSLVEMERILKQAKVIALGQCGCRKRFHKCKSPLDVCIRLDKEASRDIKNGSAKKVSLEGALEALKRSYDAGLVHIAYTFKVHF